MHLLQSVSVATSGSGASSLTDAASLLDEIHRSTATDNLVLVSSASQQRAKYWQAQISETLAKQLGNPAHFLFVQRPGDSDEFNLPDGSVIGREVNAAEKLVLNMMNEELSLIDKDLEATLGRLQSLQAWVDPKKANEELDQFARLKNARNLNLQLLRPVS